MFRKKNIAISLLVLALAGCLPVGSFEVGVEPEPTPTLLVITEEPEEPQPEPTATVELQEPPVALELGTVQGKVCFPSEFIPPMTAYFQDIATGEKIELAIGENQQTYELELPAGIYKAYAYPNEGPDFGGSFSKAVLCGLDQSCADHELVHFGVVGGETTPDVDLCDWYGQESMPPNPNATQPADESLAGLIYRSSVAGNLWQVRSNGEAYLLGDLYDVQISPDGTQALYEMEGDIYLSDLASGGFRNLTETPDLEESGPQWWPANPEVVVFHSFPYGEERGYASGFVTIMNLDGSGYTVIDERKSFFSPALHPQGHTIAYDDGTGGWLYHMADGSKEPFIPHLYGLEGAERVTSPAWSPDGSQLAWWVHGNLGAGSQVALGIFNFQGGGFQLLHPYDPISMEGGNPTPVWSPNGQYLASNVIGDQVRGSLWVFRVDGIEEINLGNAANPVWSPDGSTLAYTRWLGKGPAQEATVEVVPVGDWTIKETPLLLGSIPVAWLAVE